MPYQKKYYVYVHRYASGPKKGQVFYVGKGTAFRAYERSPHRRSNHWVNIERKYGRDVSILIGFNEEACAFSFESSLIRHYGRENLCNMTDGGGGASGLKHTAKSIVKMLNNSNSIPVECSNGMSFPSISEAARWVASVRKMGASSSMICQCLSGKFRTAYGYSWWHKSSSPVEYKSHYKRIAEAKGREVIRSDGVSFPSAAEASRSMSKELGRNVSQGNISMAASGSRVTAYGYEWRYK